jgi:hypothetical protein
MLRVALASIALGLSAQGAAAQTVKAGELSGTIVSAAGSAPSGGTEVVLLTVPSTGHFLLTQACTMASGGANNAENIQLVGSTVGRIALATQSGDSLGSCTLFDPGFALPPGEELRCVQTGASGSPGNCSVTGVLSKK